MSKLCNVLFAQELSRRLGAGDSGATFRGGGRGHDVCPPPRGDRVRYLATTAVALEPLATRFMKPTDQGARRRSTAPPPLTSPRTRGVTTTSARRAPSARATPELAAELWERSEAWTAG